MLSQPVIDLAAVLASLLPESLSKYIFLSTGSETAECAIKMAKVYTGKWEIVGFSTGYRTFLLSSPVSKLGSRERPTLARGHI